ncbi:protein of unknown function [Streptomyces murinus]
MSAAPLGASKHRRAPGGVAARGSAGGVPRERERKPVRHPTRQQQVCTSLLTLTYLTP